MRRVIAASVLMLTVAAGRGAAFAGESAGTCRPDDANNSVNLSFDQFGAKNNGATGTIGITCPVPTVPSGTTVSNLKVQVYARSSAPVSCTVYALNSDGTIISNENHQATGAPGSAAQTLTFAIPAGDHRYMHCTIPPSNSGAFSHVTSYGYR